VCVHPSKSKFSVYLAERIRREEEESFFIISEVMMIIEVACYFQWSPFIFSSLKWMKLFSAYLQLYMSSCAGLQANAPNRLLQIYI